MIRQYRLRNYSFLLAAAVIALSVIGIMVIGSARQSFQIRQIYGLVIGTVVMVILSLTDYGLAVRMRWIIYLVGCALLGAVLLIGITVNNATRWINIGVQFQPSDLMKLCLIVFYAGYFSRYDSTLNTIRVIGIALVLLAIPLYMIYKEPDLSTTIITALVFCAILFAAGLSWRIIIGILAIVIPAAAIFLSLVLNPEQTLIQDYQRDRIMSWLRPAQYSEESYQQQNSIIAIGSGQLYGKGLNNNAVNSVKNGNFIAEPQTDFIFAVAGEELGFAGCAVIVLLELMIAVMCIRIGMRAREKSGMLICVGVGSLILFQSSLNIGVTTGMLPNTGITLPFVSYGSTSLVTFMAEIGLVLNVGLQPRRSRETSEHPKGKLFYPYGSAGASYHH